MGEKYVSDFTVTANTRLNESNYLIRLEAPEPLPVIQPGQFVNVAVNNTAEVFLRRPFSIFEVDYRENCLSLIIKILGRGSEKLTQSVAGEKISLVYPLGKHFTFPGRKEKIVLIGGGSGVAPVLFLSRASGLPSGKVEILIGAKNSADLIDAENYRAYGNLHYITEDGSRGFPGLVTDHPIVEYHLADYDKVYACGPVGMMKAVARKAKMMNVFCEVSLENLMACGFGVCLCCIEPTVRGNLCICTEGPVFNINELKWQI